MDSEPLTRERAITTALERVAEGATVDLDALAAEISDPEERADFLVEAHAACTFLGGKEASQTSLEGAQISAAMLRRVLPARLTPGTRIDSRYVIQRVLGAGGLGVVYQAIDERLDRRVAMKGIQLEHGKDLAVLREGLVEESKTLAKLSDGRIITVHDVVPHENEVLLVLEYVEGCDLRDLIAAASRLDTDRELLAKAAATIQANSDSGGWSKPQESERPAHGPKVQQGVPTELPADAAGAFGETTWWQFTARVGIDIAEALGVAHRSGVLHRDIKPHNVMLPPNGRPVLLDFGLSTPFQGKGQDGRYRGTLAYSAPELLDGSGSHASVATEIFSLGVTLFEIASRRGAFRVPDEVGTSGIVARILRGERPDLGTVAPPLPRPLIAVIDHALQTEPADRYTSMDEVAEDLRCCLRGKRLRHARQGPLDLALHTLRAARRSRLVWAALAAAILAAAWLFTRDPQPMHLAGLWQGTSQQRVEISQGAPVDASKGSLGVRLTGSLPGFAYVLQLHSPSGSPQDATVRPAPPSAAAGSTGWAIPLESGTRLLTCLEPRSIEAPFGGFVLVVSERRELDLEAYLDRIQAEDGGEFWSLEAILDGAGIRGSTEDATGPAPPQTSGPALIDAEELEWSRARRWTFLFPLLR